MTSLVNKVCHCTLSQVNCFSGGALSSVNLHSAIRQYDFRSKTEPVLEQLFESLTRLPHPYTHLVLLQHPFIQLPL